MGGQGSRFSLLIAQRGFNFDVGRLASGLISSTTADAEAGAVAGYVAGAVAGYVAGAEADGPPGGMVTSLSDCTKASAGGRDC